MDLYGKLLDFLANIPFTDSPTTRKALVAYTGFSHLGIYLDWEGSQIEFFPRLLDELGRRGKESLIKFLAALPGTPQIGPSAKLKEGVAELQKQVEALDEATWQEQFGVKPLTLDELAGKEVDPGMLALTLVTMFLTPYFQVGADELARKAGPQMVQQAGEIWQRVEGAPTWSARDQKALRDFRRDPQDDLNQGTLVEILTAKLREDKALVKDLTARITSAESSVPGGNLQSLVDVTQKMGRVSGTVVGAVVGGEALRTMQAKIAQYVEEVGKDGLVIGIAQGSPGGTMNFGSRHLCFPTDR